MCIAESFGELHQIAERHLQKFNDYSISAGRYCASLFPIDPISVDLYPEDGPALHPVNIYGDGNCLARAGSLLAFGTELYHVEIRVRIACELALCSAMYQDDNFLNAGHKNGNTEWANIYAQYSPHYAMEVLTPSAVRELYQKETLLWVRNGTYAGPWQLHALSSVLGGFNVRHHLHRLVLPRQPADGAPAFTPGIMWTSTHGKSVSPAMWLPNHFVLCLPNLAD